MSATYTVTSSFLNALEGASDIYFKITSPAIVTSSTISVTPILCDLTSASWSTTSTVAGQSVRLNLAGTNCNGKTISFVVQEHDLIGHNSVVTEPISIEYNSPNTYGTWTAEWQTDGWFGIDNPPEYHFTANVVGYSETMESTNMLEVSQLVTCGDGNVDSGETCDDGNTVSNDGCSNVCQTESCGDGIKQTSETCDGSALGGATCASQIGTGTEGTLTCTSSCTFNTSACVSACDLTSASWSTTSTITGQSVRLNLAGTNCDDEIIQFAVLNSDDPVVTEPVSIAYNSPYTYGTWTAEWQDDTDGGQTDPPEYYFIASVLGMNEEIESSNDNDEDEALLSVYTELDSQCSEITTCGDYSNLECVNDPCEVASASVSNEITCGDGINCGCAWNETIPSCTSYWEPTEQGIGTCSYTANILNTCEDNNLLVRSLVALWTWDTDNTFSQNPNSSDYLEQPIGSGLFHYDPDRVFQTCASVEDTIVCPASVQVPFFGVYSFVGIIIIVVLIYLIYFLKKKNNSKKKKGKKK
jgi:cysteine-rich repeat protein